MIFFQTQSYGFSASLTFASIGRILFAEAAQPFCFNCFFGFWQVKITLDDQRIKIQLHLSWSIECAHEQTARSRVGDKSTFKASSTSSRDTKQTKYLYTLDPIYICLGQWQIKYLTSSFKQRKYTLKKCLANAGDYVAEMYQLPALSTFSSQVTYIAIKGFSGSADILNCRNKVRCLLQYN